MKTGSGVWECECGAIDYGLNPPEECEKCSAIGKFLLVPEDLVAEKEAEMVLSSKGEIEDEEDEDE